MRTFDVVTVGHFAIDHIIPSRWEDPKQTLGGPPAYVSLAARKLDANVAVISKVGEDFPEEYRELLVKNGVDLFGVKTLKSASTTSFALEYTDTKRRLKLKSCAPPIVSEDLPAGFKAKIIHIAPIADEIAPQVVAKLRNRAGILSLDPQGFLRKFDKEGRVGHRKWLDARVLGQVDIFKSSLEEIKTATGLRSIKDSIRMIQSFGVKIIIVTLGMKGAAVGFEESLWLIPAYRQRAFIDVTGAGDVLAGAFLAEFLKKREPVWCACLGSAMASFKVKTIGPALLVEKEAVYRRAKQLHEKCTQRN
jgi:sugar/nucleoside kinase (ribokinase family)